jgi:catechol 2,3-dioxygenase-like lactoylglutathione lyase family enzyme
VSLKLIQIGMNTADLPATLELFSEAFGFRNAGGQVILGELIQLQGLDKNCHALLWWLLGAQPRLQLEFFHHTRPAQRPLRADWTPADLGWTRFGIAVERFDHALAEMAKRGIHPIAGVSSVHGLRRCAYRDPFIGVIVEIMEDGPPLRARTGRQHAPALVYAAASVSDLMSAKHFYENILQLPIVPNYTLHAPGSDALWGLPGARSDAFLVEAGDVLLEIVKYASPVGRPRPADYRASDQGIVNVALGSFEKAPMEATLDRLAAAGYRPPYLIETDDLLCGYILEPEREIELAAIPETLESGLGFVPAAPFIGAST